MAPVWGRIVAKIPGPRKPGGFGGDPSHRESRLLRSLRDAGGGKPPKKGGCPVMPLLILLAAVVWVLAGCATPYPGKPAAGEPVDGAPAVHVTWLEQPDLRTPIEAVPWCQDPQGHSLVYPCKWDTRLRPAPSWDAQAAPVGVWVWRETGCQPLIGQLKIAEDNSVAWACYYAPGKG